MDKIGGNKTNKKKKTMMQCQNNFIEQMQCVCMRKKGREKRGNRNRKEED